MQNPQAQVDHVVTMTAAASLLLSLKVRPKAFACSWWPQGPPCVCRDRTSEVGFVNGEATPQNLISNPARILSPIKSLVKEPYKHSKGPLRGTPSGIHASRGRTPRGEIVREGGTVTGALLPALCFGTCCRAWRPRPPAVLAPPPAPSMPRDSVFPRVLRHVPSDVTTALEGRIVSSSPVHCGLLPCRDRHLPRGCALRPCESPPERGRGAHRGFSPVQSTTVPTPHLGPRAPGFVLERTRLRSGRTHLGHDDRGASPGTPPGPVLSVRTSLRPRPTGQLFMLNPRSALCAAPGISQM